MSSVPASGSGPDSHGSLLPLSWIEPGRRLGAVSAVVGSQRALASLVEALEGELEVIRSIRNKRGGAKISSPGSTWAVRVGWGAGTARSPDR